MRVRRDTGPRAGGTGPGAGGAPKTRRAGGVSVKASAFLDSLRAAEEKWVGDLEALMAEVDNEAARLRQEPTLEHLRAYKLRIRQLVDEVIRKTYAVHTQLGFERQGQRKMFTLVRTIDERLEELTRLLLNQEEATLSLAARLDEIRGLLLDLYR